MNIQDIYYDFPDLLTDIEKQVYDYRFKGYAEILPRFFCDTDMVILPDKDCKNEFAARKPSFGWTLDQIQELETIAGASELNEYFIHKELSRKMRRRLICPAGAETVKALCDILRTEKASGIPAPIPDWYEMGEGTGPERGNTRRFGYRKCENRSCYQTEDLERELLRCSKCKISYYCSRDCQIDDWKARHSKICKAAQKRHKMTEQAANAINMFSRHSF